MGRSGGGLGAGRGGKDSVFVPPVDQYRRRIGQISRKDKQINKEVKKKQQFKENRTEDYKDSALIVLAVLTVFAMVYLLLFFAVRKETKDV
eukprot:GFUD01065959.1.p1 GENE.GFUD01065959.1~~GFUD01065959.1.p1  ORF type:complete len:106 (+),score=33.83 GFUD01065959.1:48-320(+)